MKFETNLGAADRIFRFVLGAALIALAATGVLAPWGYVGAIFVATAFVKFCPLYALVGLKTCKAC